MAHDGIVVGGYAACPGLANTEITDFFHDLLRIPGVTGFEIPFAGRAGGEFRELMYGALTSQTRSVITAIPGVIALSSADSRWGLASADSDGRARALAFAREIHAEFELLRNRFGEGAISAVEFQSAPRVANGGNRDSQEILRDTMGEISQWDWDKCVLILEHCDANLTRHEPVKGFLSLEREIAVAGELAGTRTPIKVGINWGRSVLEARAEENAAAHIEAARTEGVLGAVVFSGVARQDGPFGLAWDDTHPPLVADEPSSALTSGLVAEAMDAISGTCLEVLGVKVGVRPLTLARSDRVRQIQNLIEAIGN